MLTEAQILSTLDNYKWNNYCQFIDLGHVYSYLIDCRLNVFKGDDDKWAIAAERLGHNPGAEGILLDIYYFGNCLDNLEYYNGEYSNYYAVSPIDWNDFIETVDGEFLKPGAKFWNIRGEKIELSHNKQDYIDAGIDPKEYEPDKIAIEEAGRLLVTKHRDLLRATDNELYKSIPADLKKILVIDEWYHRDFIELIQPAISDEHLRTTYEFNKNLSVDQEQWENNRPGAYETWQLLAKVIATGDSSLYKPTLAPNTYWKNWPDSGSM